MRKPVMYLVVSISVVVIVAAAALLVTFYKAEPGAEDILALYRDDAKYGSLTISYPLDETLFPPEIVPPVFRWKDDNSSSSIWLITIRFRDNKPGMNFLTREPQWKPEPEQWETIKKLSMEKNAEVTILGVDRRITTKILSTGHVTIGTSKDEVGAPLFYREVNLPFIDAVKDPSRIRWRFGAISSPQQPPIVMDNLPVCGNCHSFSQDGKTLGLDVDYANDKGSYAIAPVAEQMVLSKDRIITWSDYKRDDEQETFGLLSQVSPDGRVAVSTVKDKSVFVPRPDLAFSQLFFPFKGILAVYDRQTRIFQSLPGADDPQYVQSNPAWSPDGKYIVFARAKAYDLKRTSSSGKVLLSPEDCKEFLEEGKPFLFDLYRIPFNDGKGGTPEPIQGASNNGMSNYFAKYSPDGKWIVFCKAKSYMLLQPDSELYIIPAEGGTASKLRANTSRMNSWHSFSPNGKWLVFSSKANSAYTQLFLTHIDDEGRSTPAVLLSHFTAPDRAANIPEFVNAGPAAIKKISEQFVDDYSLVRAANELLKADDFDGAEQKCREALELNKNNAQAHYTLACSLEPKGMLDEATSHLYEAVRLDPNYADAHYNLGQAMFRMSKPDEAIKHLSLVVQLEPDHVKARNSLGAILLTKGMVEEAEPHLSAAVSLDPNNVDAQYNLSQAMFRLGKADEAIEHLLEVVRLRPDDADAHYKLGMALASQGKPEDAIRHWSQAVQFKPDFIEARYNLGVALARQGKLNKATEHWLEVIRIVPDHAEVHYMLANAMAALGKLDEAIRHYSKAIRLKPEIDTSPRLHDLLSMNYAKTGQYQKAVLSAQKAVDLARAAGQETLALQIERRIELYKQNKPLENPSTRDNNE
ncbi:MAG TPA: tetratricopeptide repeat protein [Sedimentisphaerales bacterium]|nr:tetratricopeptide repeat protein [Sedimentisphaerales bacterium]